MADGILDIRKRIHEKSQNYFIFDFWRWDKAKRRMFYGATDALLDSHAAAASYGDISRPDLLTCYGFLQALYVQQDAVATLSSALGITWRPDSDDRLKEIRNVRNRLTGHPSLGGKHEKPRRLSSAIISHGDITKQGFRGHIYFEDGYEEVYVDVSKYRSDSDDRLASQLRIIEIKMDEEEQRFRSIEAAQPLSRCFGTNFDYLLQRLHCDLTSEDRLPQAQAHIQMIREIFLKLKEELQTRNFLPEVKLLGVVFAGLDFLERITNRSLPSADDQYEFDLLYDGLALQIRSVIATIGAIDTKLRQPVANS